MQAIQSLKTKYYFYSTYRRFRQLWSDYQTVAGGSDLETTERKLTEFLDSFKDNYQQLVAEGYLDPTTLDRIFGDVGDVLVELLESLFDAQGNGAQFAAASVVDKVLSVAELILHDEKYRALVQHSPHLLRRLVSLLDTLQGTDARRAVLRLIAAIGTQLEAQLEIGKLEGFKKIALLLLEGDAALSTEIYSTLHTLIDAVTANPPPLLQGEVHKLMRIAEQRSAQQGEDKKPSNTTSKLTSVLSSLGTVLAQFTSKVKSEQERESDGEDSAAQAASEAEEARASSWLPAREALTAAAFAFAERERFLSEDLAPPSSAAVDAQRAQIHALMVAQGTLASLTASLTAHDELLETLCKLLLASPRNQSEFARLQGYDALLKLFESRASMVTDDAEDRAFTARAMRLLAALVLDVRGEGLVGNISALRSVVAIASSQRVSLTVQGAALNVLHALLAMNALNVAALAQLGALGIAPLLHAMAAARSDSLLKSVQALLLTCAVLQSNHALTVLFDTLAHARDARDVHALDLGTAMIRELGARRSCAALVIAQADALLSPLLALAQLEAAPVPLLTRVVSLLGLLLGVLSRSGVAVPDAATSALTALSVAKEDDVCTSATLVLALVSAQGSVAQRRVLDSLGALESRLLPSASERPALRVVLCAALAHSSRLLVHAHSRGVAVKGADAFLARTLTALLSALECSDLLVRDAAWACFGAVLPLLDELRASSPPSALSSASALSALPSRDALLAAGVVSDARSLAPLLHLLLAGLPDASVQVSRELSLLSAPLLACARSTTSPRVHLTAPPVAPESFLASDEQSAAFKTLVIGDSSASASPPHSPLPLLTRASQLSRRQLSPVFVRSADAVSLILSVSESLAVPLKRELVTLLAHVSTASDATLQRIRRGTRLDEVARRALKTRDEGHRAALLSLLGLLARYHLRAEELSQLLALCQRSVSAAMRVRVLEMLAQAAQRHTPPAHWSFSGASGHFRIAYVSRFPAASVGYTFTCWVQLLHEDNEDNSSREQGLLAWTDQQSDAALWELYVKPSGPRRRVLCVQTRRAGSPAETVTLDRAVLVNDEHVDSVEEPRWRHLVLTQRKEELSVYLDGALVQRVAHVPDPRSLLADDRATLAGYVGRRAPQSPAKSSLGGGGPRTHLHARLGPLYFLNGVWPPESVRKAWRAGPLAVSLEPTELRAFLVLHPTPYCDAADDTTAPVTAINSSLTLPSTPSKEEGEAVLTGSIQDTSSVAGVVAHSTRSLRQLLLADSKREVVGSLLALVEEAAADGESAVLAASLRALVHAVLDCAPLQLAFEQLQGYVRLQRALTRSLTALGSVAGSLDALLVWATARVNVVHALERARTDVTVTLRAPLQLFMDLLVRAAQRLGAPSTPPPPASETAALQELLKRNVQLLALVIALNADANASVFISVTGVVSASSSSSSSPPPSPFGSASLLPSVSPALNLAPLSPQPLVSSSSSSLGGGALQTDTVRSLFSDVLELALRLAVAKVSWRPLERALQALLAHLDAPALRALAALLLASPTALDPLQPCDALELERAKAAVLRVLLREMSLRAVVLTRIASLDVGAPEDALHLALALLQSALEDVRVLALKMLALLLHDADLNGYFERHFGFHVVALRLTPHPLTAELAQTLLGVALDQYRCNDSDGLAVDDSVSLTATSSDSAELSEERPAALLDTDGEDDETQTNAGAVSMVRAEAVQALLTLLPHSRDERLRSAILVEVSERLLRSEGNLERMWARAGSGEWLLGLLDQRGLSDEQTRLVAALVRRLLLHEIARRSPSPRLSALLGGGHEGAQAYVVDLLARHFREQPQLSASPDAAQNSIAHLVLLWRQCLLVPCAPAVIVAVLDAIGAMLVHNGAPVRALIHRSGLLALRAEVIAHLLQVQRLEPLTTRYFVEHFDVQQLAHGDDFRACHGLLRLLLALHQSSADDAPYRARLLHVLRTACVHVEAHALSVRDLLAQCAGDGEADTLFARFLRAPSDDFLSEYFARDTEDLRARIVQAISTRLQPHDAKFKAAIARAQSEQSGRRERARSAASRVSSERWAACASVEQRCRRLAAWGAQSTRRTWTFAQQTREQRENDATEIKL